MKKSNQNKNNRVALIALTATLVLLLAAGTLYGQGGGPGGGGGMGPGMGPGADRIPQGTDQGMAQGSEMSGGQMGGNGSLMEDSKIQSMMSEIRIIAEINKLGLRTDQVRILLSSSKQAQELVNAQFDDARNLIKGALQDQLKKVLGGADFDMSAILKSANRNSRITIRTAWVRKCSRNFERAMGVLTQEQKEKFMQFDPMGGQTENSRVGGEMPERMNKMPEGRQNGPQGEMGFGSITSLLMNPETPEALEEWLEANGE